MIRIINILILLQLFSCSNEHKKSLNNPKDKVEIDDSDSIDVLTDLDKVNIKPDSIAKKQSTDDTISDSEKVIKNKYPKRRFYTNVGETDSIYLAYEWSITFFVENGQKEKLDEFRRNNFPMEWWASGKCSYYPLNVDSVSYFLKIARNIGYKDYGFDYEKLNAEGFDGALSNSIEIELIHGHSIENLIKDYRLEFKESKYNSKRYILRAINMGAKEFINTVDLLNKDERVHKASFIFRNCEQNVRTMG